MSSEPIDVLLVGLGAVGGIYSYVLEKSKRCRVTAITRSLYEATQVHGLTIHSKKYGHVPNWRPHRLVRSHEEAADRNYQFIIACIKCLPDVEPTSTILAPFLLPSLRSYGSTNHPPPTVVLIQNGIGIEQPLAEAFPLIHIISCVSWIGANLILPPPPPDKTVQSHLTRPVGFIGPTIEHGAQDRLVFGLYEGEGFEQNYNTNPSRSNPGPCNQFIEGLLAEDGTPLVGAARNKKLESGKEQVKLFYEIVSAGGCDCEVLEYIQPARWAKNLWNGSFSTMCTLSRAPVAKLIGPEVLPYTLPVIRRTMLEILYVGRALGYGETEFPAQLIDEAISFTIQNYQSKQIPSSTEQSSTVDQNKIPDLNQPLSQLDLNNKPRSLIPTTDVFEDDEDEDSNCAPEVEIDNPLTAPLFRPSMLIDLEMNRPIELEPIVGAVLDRARAKAIETPRLDLLYSVLKVLQEQAVRQHAARLKTQQQEKHIHYWAMRKPSISGSGTSDSRQAWLDEVRRRARLGENHPKSHGLVDDRRGDEKIVSTPPMPSREHKVTGKPLA